MGAIDGTTVRQFEDKLIGFFNQGVKNLILIFSEVKYINSTGMGLLVKLADKFQEGGGDIKLVGVPEKVIALFDMLGLLSLFKIYETEEDAIESIEKTPGGGVEEPAAPPIAPPPPAPAPVPQPKPVPPQPAPTQRRPQPAPQPAPAPMPQAAPQNSLMPDGGFVIDGGLTIAPDGMEAAPAPQKPVAWPHNAACGSCGGSIQFAAKGNYKCPRCGSYISINEYGQQTVHASVNAKMVELKCPCGPQYVVAVNQMINALAAQVGFSNRFCEEINAALSDAVNITIEKSSNPSETFQVLAVADMNEMIVGVKSLNPFLAQGAPRDRRLPMIAKRVDRLEVFPLPNRGQLLKMTKKRK